MTLAPPQHLQWNIDASVGNALVKAENNAAKTIDNLSSVLLHYNSFGSDFLKRVKCSPDGFLQMAYQLAYYRQHGEPCATYESASTRMFKLGRTETVRSCSVDTVAFTKAWDDKDVKVSNLAGWVGVRNPSFWVRGIVKINDHITFPFSNFLIDERKDCIVPKGHWISSRVHESSKQWQVSMLFTLENLLVNFCLTWFSP